MANNESMATVSPDVPASQISEFELSMLEICGFENERHGDALYFFAPDGIYCPPSTHVHDPAILIEAIDKRYPVTAERPEWVTRLKQALAAMEAMDIEKNSPEDIRQKENELESALEDVHLKALQSILAKPGNQIDCFNIEGAFTCSKMRSGEFGGFAIRVYPDCVQAIDTGTGIDDLEAFVNATREILAAWEHGDLAAAVNRLRETAEARCSGLMTSMA